MSQIEFDETKQPSSIRVLRLRRRGSMFTGVCSGIADYFGVDVTFVRVGFTLASLASAWVVPMYVTLAFVLQADPVSQVSDDSRPWFDGQELVQQLKAGLKEMLRATTTNDEVAFRGAWDRMIESCCQAWRKASAS